MSDESKPKMWFAHDITKHTVIKNNENIPQFRINVQFLTDGDKIYPFDKIADFAVLQKDVFDKQTGEFIKTEDVYSFLLHFKYTKIYVVLIVPPKDPYKSTFSYFYK